MRIKALLVLAGIGAPLILAGAAGAGFDGVKVVAKVVPPGTPGVADALVCNVFATFDRSGQDRFLAAAGTPDSPMDIHVVGGTFYQNAFGGDMAPANFHGERGVFPSLCFDTFVTIGIKLLGPGGSWTNDMALGPLWPGFGPASLETSSSGWGVAADSPQADPFNPSFVNGNGEVLIGQFTTLNGTGIVGMFRVMVISNNVATQLDVSFSHFVPAPGALALLGAAGLVGRRRRRVKS